MPPKSRPSAAAVPPADLMHILATAGSAVLVEMLQARGAGSVALLTMPPVCTSRADGLSTWRLSINLDVVVPDARAA